ncbi:MAG: YfiR family protein [Caulobacteraceae bacterium]
MRPACSRGRLGVAASILLLVEATVVPPAAAETSLEIAVKATDLYKFAAFVEWPPSAFSGPTEPAMLCIAGEDPFGPVLDQAVRGQRIGGRPIMVLRLDHVDRDAPCNILFAGPSRRQPPAEVLREVRGQPVLTVTDEAGDPNARGMVDFVLRDGRVRFRIDPRMAERSGLLVSSKLLSLAVKP